MKKFLAIILAFGMLAWASSAMAALITDISVPTMGVTYNASTRDFVVSGFSSTVGVRYEDLTQEAYFGSFVLGTTNMNSVISNQGKTITYTMGNNGGQINLQKIEADYSYTPLLIGSLESLEMTVINPVLGLFEGLGCFSVTGGSLASDFGANGGLASVGISFNMPLDFYSSFAGIANTNLYPQASHVPEPSTILLLGSGLLGLVGYGRKRFSKKS